MRRFWFLPLALLLPGCVPGAVSVNVAPTPSPAPTAPVPAPSGSPTPEPGATPVPTPSPTASIVVPVGVRDHIFGMVFDEAGSPVEGATMRMRSLDQSVPYVGSTTTVQGAWSIDNAPQGANLEIFATKEGWTTRRRVGSFQDAVDEPHIVNFGGYVMRSNGTLDAGGPYFISKYPEVASTAPSASREAVEFKLQLSEPLDVANRRRFEDALRLGPVVTSGAGNGAAPEDYKPDQVLPPAVRKGALLADELTTRATVTWNAAGDEATLTMPAALPGRRSVLASFQAYLVTGPERIVDMDNNPLGQDSLHRWSPQPAGGLLRAAFYEPNAATSVPAEADAGLRWSMVHRDVASFQLTPDDAAPNLVHADMAKDGADGRITLVFDEPMLAFPGTAPLPPTTGLSFVAGDQPVPNGWTGDHDVEVTAAQLADPAFALPRNVEFRFAADAWGERVKLAYDPRNPKTLVLTLVGRPDLITTPLAIRAQDLADPAGNAIPTGQADMHVVKGALPL